MKIDIAEDGGAILVLKDGTKLTRDQLEELDPHNIFLRTVRDWIHRATFRMQQAHNWQALATSLPHSKRGGAYSWKHVLIMLLLAELLTNGNMKKLVKELNDRAVLRVVLGIYRVPDPTTICHYKYDRFSPELMRLVRWSLLAEARALDLLTGEQLGLDGAPVIAYVNIFHLTRRPRVPYGWIFVVFHRLNLSWLNFVYPNQVHNQTSTIVVVALYLLQYWLGSRSLTSLFTDLSRDPLLWHVLGLPGACPSLKAVQGFRGRYARFLQTNPPLAACFPTLESLLLEVCRQVQADHLLVEELAITELQTNQYLFNLFRYRTQVVDPDAQWGFCSSKNMHYLGYKLLLLADLPSRFPLACVIIPGNREEGSATKEVLTEMCQSVQSLFGPIPRALYADLAYDEPELYQLTSIYEMELRVATKDLPRSLRKRWQKIRIIIEQILSELDREVHIEHPRVHGLQRVQFFAETALTARVLQLLEKSGAKPSSECLDGPLTPPPRVRTECRPVAPSSLLGTFSSSSELLAPICCGGE